MVNATVGEKVLDFGVYGSEMVSTGRRRVSRQKGASSMPARINVIPGDRYGRFTIIKEVEKSRCGKRRFECVCDCGTVKVVHLGCLRSGSTVSCGCFKREQSIVHGLTDHYLYTIWSDIKQRTLNPTHKAYHNYGERGITVFSEWINDFKAFHNYIIFSLGDRPSSEYSLDRIDDNGNYEPDNLRWASYKEQARNSRVITPCEINGVHYNSLAEAAENVPVSKNTVRDRLDSDEYPNYVRLKNPYL